MNRDAWRYPRDKELLATDMIKDRPQSPTYAVAKESRRISFVANAVLVEPAVLSKLAVAVAGVHAITTRHGLPGPS